MASDEDQTVDEVQRMQGRMDRIFDEMIPTMRWLTVRHQRTWGPPTDVYETSESIIVKVEIAGVNESDLTISLDNRRLIVSGSRHDPDRKLSYQQLEIPYGHFRTEVFLPYAVERDDIEAAYDAGFLRITLPKARVHSVRIATKTERADDTD